MAGTLSITKKTVGNLSRKGFCRQGSLIKEQVQGNSEVNQEAKGTSGSVNGGQRALKVVSAAGGARQYTGNCG